MNRPATIDLLAKKFPEVNDLANSYEAACNNLDKLEAAQHRMHLTAFGAFLAGGFVGGLLMLIVLVGLYGGR